MNSTAMNQRVVILPGPHKTGTTSIQSFFVTLMEENNMGNWVWPSSHEKGFSDLGYAILFDPNDSDGCMEYRGNKIREVWKNGHSVVFGAELFDYFAALSPNELPGAFERLKSVLPPDSYNDLHVVVMYRTPRMSHLVSSWKQEIAMMKRGAKNVVWRTWPDKSGNRNDTHVPTLSEWLCSDGRWEGWAKSHVDKIIASQINPMGVADAFVRYGNMSVTIGDLSNIVDAPSTVACEILGIPCSDENKVIGWENKEPIVENQRHIPASLGLSNASMNAIEDILRWMDCYYYCGLRDNVTVLHGKDSMFTANDGWKGCCNLREKLLSPLKAYEMLRDIGCRESEGTAVVESNKGAQISSRASNLVKKESPGPVSGAGDEEEARSLIFLAILFLVMVAGIFRIRRGLWCSRSLMKRNA